MSIGSLLCRVRMLCFSALCCSAWADADRPSCYSPEDNLKGKTYTYIKSLQPHCHESHAFNYQLALAAIQQEKFEDAIKILQTVIQQNPLHAGAWMDLATIYYQQGDKSSLKKTVKQIKAQFELPAAVAATLARYQRWIEDSSPGKRQKVQNLIQFEMEAGYADNINNGPNQLTIDLGGIDVELSESSFPKSDSFASASVFLSRTQVFLGWEVNGWGALRNLTYNTENDYNSTWALIGGSAARKIGASSYIQVSAYQLWLKSQNNTDQSVSWGQIKLSKLLTEKWEIAVWGEQQNTDTRKQLDSRRQSVGAEWAYNRADSRWFLEMEYGYDEAEQARNGGDRELVTASLGVEKHWTISQIRAKVSYRSENDAAVYSQVLFGDLRRNQQRIRLDGSYSHQLTKRQQISLWVEYSNNQSKIELFANRGWRSGLRWRYSL